MVIDTYKNRSIYEKQPWINVLHIDLVLFTLLIILSIASLLILYSASGRNLYVVQAQALRFLFSFGVLIVCAQIPPETLKRWSIELYSISLLFLIAVLIMGHIGKGAQRWLSIGFFRFQPSELMKVALPLFLATQLDKLPLPLKPKSLFLSTLIMVIPAALIAKQPDLGTAIMVFISGSIILFLAGLSHYFIVYTALAGIASIPITWHFLHDYQKQRLLTFFNPEGDALGSGYHIIQSKIAIGSGGVFGKGWLNGTQSNLHFLPEHTTDFIFAVCGEELGFVGCIILLFLFSLIIFRGIYITLHAQDTFSRLLAGSLTFTFAFACFINMGMVTGIVPVVGIPLPLISYGGSSMVTMMASFGMLMSIQTHRKLLST